MSGRKVFNSFYFLRLKIKEKLHSEKIYKKNFQHFKKLFFANVFIQIFQKSFLYDSLSAFVYSGIILALADEFTKIYTSCGEMLAFKRFSEKNGHSRQYARKLIESQQTPSTSNLPPPPPAPGSFFLNCLKKCCEKFSI